MDSKLMNVLMALKEKEMSKDSNFKDKMKWSGEDEMREYDEDMNMMSKDMMSAEMNEDSPHMKELIMQALLEKGKKMVATKPQDNLDLEELINAYLSKNSK